jgi:hypothetical protein
MRPISKALPRHASAMLSGTSTRKNVTTTPSTGLHRSFPPFVRHDLFTARRNRTKERQIGRCGRPALAMVQQLLLALAPPGEPAPGSKYSRRIKIPGYALSRFAPACAQEIAGNPFPVGTIDFGARRGRIPVHTKPALNGREHARIALSSLSILQPAEVRDVCYAHPLCRRITRFPDR